MADHRLLPPDSSHGGGSPLVPATHEGLASVFQPMPDREEEEEGGLDLKRYLFALVRRKWLLLGAALIGAGGASVAWKYGAVEYTTNANIWVQVESNARASGDVEPIRESGLLDSNAWLQLLRSFAVLDTVAVREKLYLRTSAQDRPAFESFELTDRYRIGAFRLSVSEDGKSYTLTRDNGETVEQGTLGSPIGADLGWAWTPDPGDVPAGSEMRFSVIPPRDAAQLMASTLRAGMDKNGNFMSLSLRGDDPQQIASVLNAILERFVAMAAEVKKGNLDQKLVILQQQLTYAQDELERAEEELEGFRVRTITLPSDNSAPISPGLAETRGAVFGTYFGMRVQLDQLERDRQRLSAALDTIREEKEVRIEALQAIPAAAQSLELTQILGELVDARSQLRTLRDRYADEYSPIQVQLSRIRTLEQEATPRVVQGILGEMGIQEKDLSARLDSASVDLASIPPRTIEEARLRRQVAIQERFYNQLRQSVETARLASLSSIPDIDILDRAVVPRQPTNDNRIQMAEMVFLGVMGAAVVIVILLDLIDPHVRYPNQVSRDIGLDILGSIPRVRTVNGAKGAENAAHVLESFRELRLTTGFAYGSAGPVTLVITSPSQGEGKSLISTNLAVAYAEVGRRTLLVDADTRRGDAHRLLNCYRAPGITDYLRENASDEIIQETEYDNLHFIGSGTRGGSTPELLASSRMVALLAKLKQRYEVIILDSPPLAAGGDAVVLSALTGNMALVIRTGSTEKPLTIAKLEPLARLPIRILGAILNDVELKGPHFRYYSYLPGYEPSAESELEAVPQLVDAVEGGGDQAP